MKWHLTQPGHETGNAKEERKKEKTPTPTHLAQNGRTLKGQGERTGRRTAGLKKPNRGGARTEAPENQWQRSVSPAKPVLRPVVQPATNDSFPSHRPSSLTSKLCWRSHWSRQHSWKQPIGQAWVIIWRTPVFTFKDAGIFTSASMVARSLPSESRPLSDHLALP